MDQDKILKRDKWTCRRCGAKFVDLSVVNFDKLEDASSYITLCSQCNKWSLDYPLDSFVLFKNLNRENKIVLVGDIHGQFDKLDEVLTAEAPFDFFVTVGDVGVLEDAGNPNNIAIIDKWSNGYYIKGNHDTAQFFEQLHLTQEINGLHVCGLNGVLKSDNFANDKLNNISFKEIMYLSHLKDVDLLVTHQPPTGVINGYGEPIFEELLMYVMPKIYIFGHLHTYGIKFYGKTFCISLPLVGKGYAVAYFRGKDLTNLEVILKKGKRIIRV
jgi:predicted phosphodiesterase